jgi:HEAT repeat protein
MAAERDVEKAPPIVERFVRQLVVTNKAVMLYPPSSDITRENATNAVVALDETLAEFPDLTIAVTKQGLYFEDEPIFPGQATFLALSQELYNRKLASFRFHAGTTMADVIGFLYVLKHSPEEIVAAGGYEAMMWEQGVAGITVIETQVMLVDQSTSEEGSAATLSAPTTAVQKRTHAPRTRERIELSRVMGSDQALRDYLSGRIDVEGDALSLADMQKRFSEMARVAAESSGANAAAFTRMFADALWSLEPNMRVELIEQEMLPEARNSDTLAGTLKRIDFEEIVRMLVAGDTGFDSRRTGFARALKNLVQVTQTDRADVASATSSALRSEGVSEATINDVVSEVAPTRLTVRRARHVGDSSLDGPASMALRLIEHAPLSRTADASDDPEVAALQEEAAIGVTDGDVIAAFVALAGLDPRATQFANTMSALEDLLDMLVTRGDIETAAEAAITLVLAAQSPQLTPGQCQRLQNAVSRFARPEDIRTITHTLRIYAPGQPEYEAAQRLLNTLGALAVRPLLEQLANETDRAERKALVDLISKDAVRHVGELTQHVGDSRWYFVRNVVAILGSTKSQAALGPLERPLRHSDARVRRETIRALSGVHERRATEMLVQALEDEDPHNVQLAARYLGAAKTLAAIPALEMVARGEGRGSRENGPRVEAIEALGRMGANSALPTLEALARKRAIIGASRVRELRVAAESAIAAIRARGGAK